MTARTTLVALLLVLAPSGARASPFVAPSLLAAAVAAAAQPGTVYTTEGGRVRGTILEAGPGGVSVQTADGSTRKLDAAQVARVEYSDGTTWKPTAPAPASAASGAPAAATAAPAAATAGGPGAGTAPAPVPTSAPAKAPAAIPASAAAATPAAAPAPAAKEPGPIVLPIDQLDTVYLANGGRVRGLVLEESPSEGLVMRLVDGSERRYAVGEALLVQYANGTVSAQPRPQPKAQ